MFCSKPRRYNPLTLFVGLEDTGPWRFIRDSKHIYYRRTRIVGSKSRSPKSFFLINTFIQIKKAVLQWQNICYIILCQKQKSCATLFYAKNKKVVLHYYSKWIRWLRSDLGLLKFMDVHDFKNNSFDSWGLWRVHGRSFTGCTYLGKKMGGRPYVWRAGLEKIGSKTQDWGNALYQKRKGKKKMLTRSIFGNLFIIQIDSQGFLFMQLEPWRLPTIKCQGMCLPVIYSDLCREFSEDAVHGSHGISKVAHKLSWTLKVIKRKKKCVCVTGIFNTLVEVVRILLPPNILVFNHLITQSLNHLWIF